MKRLYSAFVIFAAIIFLSIWSGFYVKSDCEKITVLSDNVINSYNKKGNCPETHKELNALKEFTDKYHKGLSFFVRREAVSEIYFEVSRLENLLDNESEEFVSQLELIKSRAELVYSQGNI